jgi:glyoxylase I family protein
LSLGISGIAHANVNCSELGRSLRFYTGLGLRATAHTAPDRPQDCRAFGLEGDGQWDAWMLAAGGDPGGTALDLLEWKLPRPVGRPPRDGAQLGFSRLALRLPDAAALLARLRGAGVDCREARGDEGGFSARDPDGTLLELVPTPGDLARLSHVAVNCSDLARSLAWYQRVLGLSARSRSTRKLESGEWLGVPGPLEQERVSLVPPARPEGFAVELCEWKQPRAAGRPAAQANHLGIFRMAFLVEDAHAAWAELRAQGVVCPPPVWLSMGPEIPIDGLWAVFFPDPDGTCLEMIQSPRVLAR